MKIVNETVEIVNDVISIEEFSPEFYDCEADGGCGNGHIHECK
ncbi:hypothetical protein HMPREF1987_00989 [Peptostreptococcaceae bacterium oral taxon 113 str. W5053]|nr:hypothetical protein HMPREF1987_00989 [Peptostreptococcaceae bacterium oral taxon 113 str. W5053]